jgi:hypothetical protein
MTGTSWCSSAIWSTSHPRCRHREWSPRDGPSSGFRRISSPRHPFTPARGCCWVSRPTSGSLRWPPLELRRCQRCWTRNRQSELGGAGLPEFSNTATAHVFGIRGAMTIESAVEHGAEYRFAGRSRHAISGTIAVWVRPLAAIAGDAKTVLVERDCLGGPFGPGCQLRRSDTYRARSRPAH